MDQVLDQLPLARKQARQRILQGQPVPKEEKILSLYEPDVPVIVRKKAGADAHRNEGTAHRPMTRELIR